MKKDQKELATATAEIVAMPRTSDFRPISIASPRLSDSREANGFDLIDEAAEIIRASEQRAVQAEEKAQKVSARAIEALRAAQLTVEQSQAQARLAEQQAVEQAKLAQERIAKAEALSHERIEKAQAWAQEAEERAMTAEGQLKAAEARATDAEERLEHLNQALRRKLSAAARTPSRAANHENNRSLN
jgi:hypothetical protein